MSTPLNEDRKANEVEVEIIEPKAEILIVDAFQPEQSRSGFTVDPAESRVDQAKDTSAKSISEDISTEADRERRSELNRVDIEPHAEVLIVEPANRQTGSDAGFQASEHDDTERTEMGRVKSEDAEKEYKSQQAYDNHQYQGLSNDTDTASQLNESERYNVQHSGQKPPAGNRQAVKIYQRRYLYPLILLFIVLILGLFGHWFGTKENQLPDGIENKVADNTTTEKNTVEKTIAKETIAKETKPIQAEKVPERTASEKTIRAPMSATHKTSEKTLIPEQDQVPEKVQTLKPSEVSEKLQVVELTQPEELLPQKPLQITLGSETAPANKVLRIVKHIVVKGDTLWDIAATYVKDPLRYPELAKLSHIKNPDLIYPKQEVIIHIYE